MLRSFRIALAFLTVLPVRLDEEPDAEALGRSAGAFPLVGLGLGLTLAGLALVLQPLFPLPVAAALVLAVWVVLTGGLHLDGWADCCDALPGARARERRLQILRDSRIGSFGAAGVTLLLLLKAAALSGVLALGRPGLILLLLAPVLGRAALLGQAALFPLARTEGLAVVFVQGLSSRPLTVAAVTTLALVAGLLGWSGLLIGGVAAAVAVLFGLWAARRLGGLTGDVYGAGCELVELTVLLLGLI